MNKTKLMAVNLIAVLGISGILSVVPVFADDTTTGTTDTSSTVTSDTTTAPAKSFNDAMNNFRAVKNKVKTAKDAIKSAKSENKAQKEADLLAKRKEQLQKVVDVLIKRSEGVKARVVKNKVIYGDLESSIIAEIDTDIAKLNEFKTKVGSAQTGEELKTLAGEIRKHRSDVNQTRIRRLLILAHIARFEMTVIKKAEDRAEKISAKLTEMANAGKDVSAMQTLMSDASAKIVSAKEQLTNLKNTVNQQDITETKLGEVKKSLQDIKNQIKAVYDIFKQVAQQAKSLTGTSNR